MNQPLENWLTRCPYNTICNIYHQTDYSCVINQSSCILYPLYQRIVEARKGNKLETILDPTDDGTAWRGE